jgi:GcrA cell cycle regulator
MWDRERDAALVELHSQGLSFAEIGRRIGVTRNAAISRFHWIRGTKFRSEHERKAKVAAERERRLKLLREKQEQAVQELRRDLATDMLRRDAILKALESGAACKLIGLELNVSGARVHQLAARARARQLMLRGLAMLEAAKGTETGDAAESPGLIDVQAATR